MATAGSTCDSVPVEAQEEKPTLNLELLDANDGISLSSLD